MRYDGQMAVNDTPISMSGHAHDYATHRGEGTNYIDYSRYVYNNGAYSGSGWVEPSDLGVRYAASAGDAATLGGSSLTSILNNAGASGDITTVTAGTAISTVNIGSIKYITVKGYTSVTAYGSFVATGTATYFDLNINLPSTINTVAGIFIARYGNQYIAMGTISRANSTNAKLAVTFAAGQAPPNGTTAIWSANFIYS